MATAKIIYFNQRKALQEDDTYKHDASLIRVTWTGELLAGRPDLYDYVGDIDCGEVSAYPYEYEKVCDNAFRAFNRVDEGDMEGLKIRSMCVGDIVLFPDGKLYVVQGCGWKEFSGNSLVFWNLPKVEEQGR